MEPANLENLFEKVRTIVHGPHADLLEKFINLLYEQEMEEPEYFSPKTRPSLRKARRS